MKLQEQHIYGSARLGVVKPDLEMIGAVDPSDVGEFDRVRGMKRYELSNHLGNVLTVISDRKIATVDNGVNIYYHAEIISYTDYYPFGAPMSQGTTDRTWSVEEYRYGFGGHEEDTEIYGSGNQVDMGDRWLDVRLGRTLKIDAKFYKYPSQSPYSFAVCNPILYVDPDGKEIDLSNLTAEEITKYNAVIEMLSSSELFSYYYQQLVESKTSYKIKASNDLNGRQVGGYFDPNKNEVGIGVNFSSYVVAQELFHAYQIDGGFYSNNDPKPYSTIETEGDIMSAYVMLECGGLIPTFGDWIDDILYEAYENIPNSTEINSKEYQEKFQKAVDDRIQYYVNEGLDTPTYTSPNTGEEPKAIESVIKGAEEELNSTEKEKK